MILLVPCFPSDELSLCPCDQSMHYINGFDDHAIIAGAGTCGIEIMKQVPKADVIVVIFLPFASSFLDLIIDLLSY